MHKHSHKKQRDFLEGGMGRHLHSYRLNYIKNKVSQIRGELHNPIKVLDLGCGDGVITKELEAITNCNDEIFALDNDQARIQRAQKYCKTTRFLFSDAEKVNFKDNYFDIIIVHHVIEHIFDDRGVLKECYRLLKENGSLILGIPHEGGIIGRILRKVHKKLYQESEHVNFYSINSIRKLISESGFKEIEFCKFGFLFPFYYIHLLLLQNKFTFSIGNCISQKFDCTADSLMFLLRK